MATKTSITFKPCRLVETNYSKIDAWITQVQKGCRERLISLQDVFDAIHYYELKLEIPKSSMDGIALFYDKYSNCWSKYYSKNNYPLPQTTIVKLINKKGKWTVENIYRGDVHRHYFESQIPNETIMLLGKSFESFN